MEGVSGMPGERFSRLYVQPRDLTQDSDRARYRIAALFRETIFKDHAEQLAVYVSRAVGIPILGSGDGYLSDWNQFIRKCPTRDFLDTVTLVYRYLFWRVDEEVAHWWRDVVRQIFAEERLACQIDDVCGVHPAIDQEFQRNMISAVASLQSHRYQNVSHLIETVSTHLYADPLLQLSVVAFSESGYVEGRNVAIEYHWGEGNRERLPHDRIGLPLCLILPGRNCPDTHAIAAAALRKISMPISGTEQAARLAPRFASRRSGPLRHLLAVGRGPKRFPGCPYPWGVFLSDSPDHREIFLGESPRKGRRARTRTALRASTGRSTGHGFDFADFKIIVARRS
jgi:hypothetical protein